MTLPNFPGTPAVGDVFTDTNGTKYVYTGTGITLLSKWQRTYTTQFNETTYQPSGIAGALTRRGELIGPDLIVGRYYDQGFLSQAHGTVAGAANRMDLFPYFPSTTHKIDRLGVYVTTGVGSALGKLVIYSSTKDGWPDKLLLATGDLDLATTSTYREATVSFTFEAGVLYWLGMRHSSTATVSGIPLANCLNMGLPNSSGVNYVTVIRRTVTYANAAPDPWVFTATELVANNMPPSIRFRIA